MSRFFAEGGLMMYPTLAFGLLQLAVGIAYAADPRRRLVSLSAVLGIVTLVCGATGLVLGAVSTSLYVERVAPAKQFAQKMLGLSESLNNLSLALALIVVATLVLAFGALRAARAAGPERD